MRRLAAIVESLPTTVSSWRRMWVTVRRATTTPAGGAAAVVSAVTYLSLFALPGNLGPLARLLTSSLAVPRKVDVLLSVYPPFSTRYSLVDSWFILLLTGLVAANVAVLVHRRRLRTGGEAGSGTAVGLVGGVLGTGCGACGSLLVPLAGISTAVAVLPFGGVEVLVASGLILVVALSSGTQACALDANAGGSRPPSPE